ncbi:MAG: hypothetical protein J6S67_23990 [Methanobrevibacter sp.]|nr:hypothetical protein [Methanobrevibacter sp.]
MHHYKGEIGTPMTTFKITKEIRKNASSGKYKLTKEERKAIKERNKAFKQWKKEQKEKRKQMQQDKENHNVG